jgi:hypothetical protein
MPGIEAPRSLPATQRGCSFVCGLLQMDHDLRAGLKFFQFVGNLAQADERRISNLRQGWTAII